MNQQAPGQSSSPRPVRLALIGSAGLEIEWSDGQRRIYDVGELRTSCPCAGCLNQPPPEPAATAEPAPPVTIRQMSPVGNYAYKILFSDGHETGIYPLALLRNLGREKP